MGENIWSDPEIVAIMDPMNGKILDSLNTGGPEASGFIIQSGIYQALKADGSIVMIDGRGNILK